MPTGYSLNLGKFTRVRFVNDDGTLTREAALEMQTVKKLAEVAGGTVFASTIAFVPVGGVGSSDVQAAIAELDAEKADATALTGKQPLDPTLTALAGVVTAADRLVYATGVDTFAVTPFTAFARTLGDDVDAATARGTLGLGTAATLTLDTDGTLAANSDLRVASQKAVKSYADGLIAAQDAMVFKGVIDCSANPNYPAADRGHTYRVSVAGKIGGASGVSVEAGDILLCLTDGTAAGDQATVGASWSVIQTNLDGAVVGPASAVGNNVALFNGVTGKLIKDSGVALNAAGVGLGSVTNDAQTKAAVVPNTAPSAGQVLVGNAGGTAYAPIALSGDVTLTSAGVATVANTQKILANVTLGSAGPTLASGTFAARKFLEIHIYISGYAGSDTASLQFNGAAGTAYRYQWATMAAGAVVFTAGLTAASTDRIKVAAVNTTLSRRVTAYISNDSAVTEKLVVFVEKTGTGSAATQATRNLGDGAWISGAATQITSVSLISGANLNAGTQMVIFGWN